MTGIPWWAYLISTAITALVSGGGVVLGQLLAAKQAKTSASAQLALRERELAQAALEKRLDARALAYARFIPAAQATRTVLVGWAYKLEGMTVDPVRSAVASFQEAETLVILHGHEKVRSGARSIAQILHGSSGKSTSYLDLRNSPSDEISRALPDVNKRFFAALDAFERLARSDVQGDDFDIVNTESISESPSGSDHQGTDNEPTSETQGDNNGSRDHDEPGSPAGDRQ